MKFALLHSSYWVTRSQCRLALFRARRFHLARTVALRAAGLSRGLLIRETTAGLAMTILAYLFCTVVVWLLSAWCRLLLALPPSHE